MPPATNIKEKPVSQPPTFANATLTIAQTHTKDYWVFVWLGLGLLIAGFSGGHSALVTLSVTLSVAVFLFAIFCFVANRLSYD